VNQFHLIQEPNPLCAFPSVQKLSNQKPYPSPTIVVDSLNHDFLAVYFIQIDAI